MRSSKHIATDINTKSRKKLGEKRKKHICVHMILMLLILLWNTNNKMATPAPVQLQRPVMVSDLVFFVYLSMEI